MYELEYEGGELEYEGGELEYEGGGELEYEGGGELEYEGGELENESPFHEMMELELAGELLEISSEQELEQFLGGVFRKALGGIKRFASSSAGRALGGALKGLAKKALPGIGGALGNLVVPGLGGMVGSKLGSLAGNLFEFELEGLGEQEQEFEAARRFVRLAGHAAQLAARAPRGAPPKAIAQRALVTAARRQLATLSRAAGAGAGAGAGGGTHRRTGYGLRRPVRSIYGAPRRRASYGGYRRRSPSRYGYRRPSYAGGGGYAYGYDEPVSGVPSSSVPYSDAGPMSGGGSGGGGYPAESGRWVRRHGKIILLGA